MEEWAKQLDSFLEFTDREILKNNGEISIRTAKEYAENEFGKYRITQDKLFESDFDRVVAKLAQESIDKS